MDDTPAERHRTAPDTRHPAPDTSHEWRLWRRFGFTLGFIIFMLVVISVSL